MRNSVDELLWNPESRLLDNPEWDCTDSAHPAWWRGNDHGFATCVQRVTAILDGEDTDTKGVSNLPQWDALRARLVALVVNVNWMARKS